jgi:hypothetical protein
MKDSSDLYNKDFDLDTTAPSATFDNMHSRATDDIRTFESEELSQVATRSIFSWLRNVGYPRSEALIKNHPGLDMGESEHSEDDEGSGQL